MKISNDIKRNVVNDWLNAFPTLTNYAQNKFFKILGPLVIGMELMDLRRFPGYRPHFSCYALWNETPKKCFDGYLLSMEINNLKGLQFDVPYLEHSKFITQAVECTKKQISINFEGTDSIKSLFNFVDKRFDDVLTNASPTLQLGLLDLKFYAALYIGDNKLAKRVIDEITSKAKRWRPELYVWATGPIENVTMKLFSSLTDPTKFFQKLAANKADNKISKLQIAELIA